MEIFILVRSEYVKCMEVYLLSPINVKEITTPESVGAAVGDLLVGLSLGFLVVGSLLGVRDGC